MNNDLDKIFMHRALELAKKGAGFVSPNPLVGCVIVADGKIMAEGYHKKFGDHHAEIMALKKLETRNLKLGTSELAMYVTLEPHCYQGKTAPCTDAIIAAGSIKRVVIGMKDPNPKVAGKGIRQLRAAGIQVDVGVLQKECEEVNEVFTHWVQTKTPFVVLKMATTLDGAVTLKKGKRSTLSSPESMRYVHELRQHYDAIGVGIGTVQIDDPLLTTRGVPHTRNAVRVVFDTDLHISAKATVLKQPGKTIIFTKKNIAEQKIAALLQKCSGVTIVPLSTDKSGQLDIKEALALLGELGLASILIEGGVGLAQSFLKAHVVNKLLLTVTPHVATDGEAPKMFTNKIDVSFHSVRWQLHGNDAWFVAQLK